MKAFIAVVILVGSGMLAGANLIEEKIATSCNEHKVVDIRGVRFNCQNQGSYIAR